jgi:DNA-binding MarR family transcriptional regulator
MKSRKWVKEGASPSAREAQLVLDGVRRVVQLLRESSVFAERKVGVSGAQLFVLRALAQHGPLTVNELAEQTLTHQSSVSLVVAKLESRGFVRKGKSPNGDRRFVWLELTSPGRGLLSQAPETAQELLVRNVRKMGPAQRRRVNDVLKLLVRAMEGGDFIPNMFFEDDNRGKGTRKGR